MSEKSDIIERIQKLMRLSQSSNQHEAELAAQRASQLMAKYQIEQAEVELKAVESGTEKVVSFRYVIPGQKLKVLWLNTLAHAAARLYDGEILITSNLWEQVVYFVGFESEITLMVDTFQHLYRSWQGIVEHDLAIAKETSVLEHAYAFQPRDTMKFKHGHGQGYASALFHRCSELTAQRKRQVENSCTALVLVRDTAIKVWMDERYGKKRTAKFGRKATSGSGLGYAAGVQAGRSVALGGGLAGPKSGGMLQ